MSQIITHYIYYSVIRRVKKIVVNVPKKHTVIFLGHLIIIDKTIDCPQILILNVPKNNGVIFWGHSNDTTMCQNNMFVFIVNNI